MFDNPSNAKHPKLNDVNETILKFLDLPLELLVHTLRYVSKEDLANSILYTCRELHGLCLPYLQNRIFIERKAGSIDSLDLLVKCREVTCFISYVIFE